MLTRSHVIGKLRITVIKRNVREVRPNAVSHDPPYVALAKRGEPRPFGCGTQPSFPEKLAISDTGREPKHWFRVAALASKHIQCSSRQITKFLRISDWEQLHFLHRLAGKQTQRGPVQFVRNAVKGTRDQNIVQVNADG